MQDELQAFLESPTARAYRKAREALLDEVATTRGANLLTLRNIVILNALAAEGDYAAVLERIDELQPVWALSPRIHYLAAVAAQQLGDVEVTEIERFAFQSCLDGILATGDGSPDAPYLITYPSDEYDVLNVLGLEPRSQAVVEHRGLLCDVLTCTYDEQIWFELTGVLHDPRHHSAEIAGLQGLRL